MHVAALQTATPTPVPGIGPEAVAAYWPALVRAGWFLAGFIAVVVVGWFVVEPLVGRAINRRNRNNPTLQEALSRYLRLFVVVVAFFVAAGTAGYADFIGDSALVIAAGTLAIGVAGQTVIGSIVSGLVLVVDPEFNVGNYIEWAGGEGTVQSITLRVTRVLTPDGELITVPNTVLTGQEITRPYGRKRQRIVERVGLSYEADLTEALDHLTAVAAEVDGIESEPTPKAYVDEFGSDAVILRAHYWVGDPRRRDVFSLRSAYARALKTRLDDAGITISPASKRELEGRIEVADADEQK
ncbi:mechanosensitive ion channel family protein [Haloplanus halobius]|uniref:mechanosensitive ion channel family protein n=1 Tax=Haloplanus halobius TaxID=2934938 RepID=UPI00200CD9B5|nr:mechanosensitive ion channel domain-containing protein [Haloplanus sp. XH21]